MTPTGKANNHSHSFFPRAVSGARRRTTVEGTDYDNLVAMQRRILTEGRAPLCRTTLAGTCFDRSGTLTRSAAGLPVQSRSLRQGRGASWGANQQHDGHRCLGERFEQSFEETPALRVYRNSVAWSASFGRAKSPTSSSRNARAALSAPRNSTSQATANLPMKRSWSCSTSFDRGSGGEFQNTAARPLEESASPVATEGLVSCRDHNSRGCAAGNAAQLGCEGNRLSRRPDRDEGPWTAEGVTAGETATNSCSGGAAVARLAHNQEVVGSIPTPATSSGDGLGIHQPGSNTRGGSLPATAPSGRAAEAATCPAVARSNEGRAA